jgi:hypothetical protein
MDAYKASPQDSDSGVFCSHSSTDTIPIFPDVPDVVPVDTFLHGHATAMSYTPSRRHASAVVRSPPLIPLLSCLHACMPDHESLQTPYLCILWALHVSCAHCTAVLVV